MYKQILVPLEEGKYSWNSLDHAQKLADQLRATLVLLRVITVLPAGHEFDRRLQIEEGSSAAKAKAAAEAELSQLEKDLRDQGVEATTAIVISEEPIAQAIVNYAEANRFDLMIMPSQPRSAIGRWLFGSVSEKVRRRSPVPVLFVPETK